MKMIGTFYALWHPKLGYVTFDSRSSVRFSSEPNPRGVYSKLLDARKRLMVDFWAGTQRFPGSCLEIRVLEMAYTILPEKESAPCQK